MSHFVKVCSRVEATIERNVIREMNELLCMLSEDLELTRQERYEQQQRLRVAVYHHSAEKKELAEQRLKWLTRGGVITL
ncbi:DUF2526 family protein [Candidatus Pantoea formicae]|uniref:DUF2526 family protein n=1 Tax=Candidatus Pantoea formicae TaxID=2608355 RepID=UPI003EDA0155